MPDHGRLPIPAQLCLRVLVPQRAWPHWLGWLLQAIDGLPGLTLQVREVGPAMAAGRVQGADAAWRRRVPALAPWAPADSVRHRWLATDGGSPALTLAIGIEPGVLDSSPPEGEVWLLCDGDGHTMDGNFPLLRDIACGRGVALQLVSRAAGSAPWRSVQRAHVGASSRYRDGLQQLAPAALRLLRRALSDLQRRVPPAATAATPLPAVPLVHRAWSIGLKGAWHAWRARQRARWYSEYWRIGVIEAPVAELLNGSAEPAPVWITGESRAGYWADPFGLPGDPTRLTCEFFDQRTGVGHLEVLRLDAQRRISARTRLEVGSGRHVSFPNVFVLDGRRLALAESVSERRSTLYEVDAEGLWQPLSVLLHGVAAADPALFRWESRYWLAYTDADQDAMDNLCLMHASALEGPWLPHAGNPVKIDVRSARMAGAVICHDGALIRPGQDCLHTYGAGVALHRIEHLSPDRFEEVEIRRLVPDPHGDCPHGLHTLTAWGDVTLVDGKRHGLNLRALWRKLLRRRRLQPAAASAIGTTSLQRRRVMIYVPHLRLGGAETSMLRLAEGMVKAGQEVSIVVHTMSSCELSVPAGVELIDLGAQGTAHALWKLVRLLRARRPHGLLTAFPHTNVASVFALALSRTATRCVITEHAPLSRQIVQQGHWRYRILPPLVRWAYRRADAVVAVSGGVRDDLHTMIGASVAPLVIHNPVLPPDLEARLQQTPAHPWLRDETLQVVLSVSRLSEEKDLPMLVQAFATLHRERPQTRLLLVGEGPALEAVQTLIDRLGLSAVAQLPGRVAEPLHWMRRAAVFALASRYEGFGNVLVEALAAGTPVVSTDCPVGPREILAGGRYGTLVPVGDAQAMAAALAQAVDTHRQLPAGARDSALHYTHDNATAAYLRLFDSLYPAGAPSC